jgi:hypothetical protein
MEKTEEMPIWVYLAFSSITTRKGALWLIWSSVIFTAYCIPWSSLFPKQAFLTALFLLDDWTWVAMMAPLTIWYWFSLRWIDINLGWQNIKLR